MVCIPNSQSHHFDCFHSFSPLSQILFTFWFHFSLSVPQNGYTNTTSSGKLGDDQPGGLGRSLRVVLSVELDQKLSVTSRERQAEIRIWHCQGSTALSGRRAQPHHEWPCEGMSCILSLACQTLTHNFCRHALSVWLPRTVSGLYCRLTMRETFEAIRR